MTTIIRNNVLYSPCQLTKQVILPITAIGKNLSETLENTLNTMLGGKCIVEGFVKSNSVNVLTYSSGLLQGDKVVFDVVLNCSVCYPVAGMVLNCRAIFINKAGIQAESSDEHPSPFILFVSRDHHYSMDKFNAIKEKDVFQARVIAQRFELNDPHVSIIAELYNQPRQHSTTHMKKKQRLITIEDEEEDK